MTLIINADDFGLCHSVNEAILDVYKAGNLTSATLMVGMPGAEEAAQMAADNPGLGVGLHFTLTEGKPLTGAPSLTDEGGRFLKRYDLIRRVMTGRARTEEIADEFRAQLRRLRDLGVTPTHVDSHQHLHMVPAIFRAVQPIASAEELPIRLAVPSIAPGLVWRKPVKWLKQQVHRRNYRKLLRGAAFRHNDRLVSIHDYPAIPEEKPAIFTDLLTPFSGTGDVVEMFIHPYKPEPDLYALYPDDAAAHEPFFQTCFLEHRLLTARPHLFSAYNLATYAAV